MNKLFILIAFVFCFSYATKAQDKKTRTPFQAGEIIVLKDAMQFDDDYTSSHEQYQKNIIGIATGNAAPMKKSDLVIKEGITQVKVNNENGTIKKGDLITSSSTPGVGMKATLSGMVIGVALEDATANETVKVRISIQYVKQ